MTKETKTVKLTYVGGIEAVNVGGITFERNVPTEVSAELASLLTGNKDFTQKQQATNKKEG